MIKQLGSLSLVAATGLSLAACGSSSGTSTPAGSPPAGSTTPADTSSSSSSASASAGSSSPGTDPTAVDVCALLTPTDAAEVARTQGLDGAQTAATVYRLTATKQPATGGIEPTSSCSFLIDDVGGAEGTVVFSVGSSKDYDIGQTGPKLSGLGDEAYDNDGAPTVRVGGLEITVGEDSFPDDFTVALLRKMAPNLK